MNLNIPRIFPRNLPYRSHFIDVLGSKMHYLDEGEGPPIVLLHDMPTFSYLWRNIIPSLSLHARCIAPDFIGMGLSSKPDISYRVFDHIKYIEEFISQLRLDSYTLVVHGWGSVVGLDIAMRCPERINAIAFMEPYLVPENGSHLCSLPVQEVTVNIMQHTDRSYNDIIENNFVVEKVLPQSILRRLTSDEMAMYQAPFTTPHSRLPLLRFVRDLPFEDGPKDVLRLINNYSEKLCSCDVNKLLLYAIPGLLTTVSTIRWAQQKMRNLQVVDIGDALHYGQEDCPKSYARALSSWYCNSVLPIAKCALVGS